jgi:Flp pilus assembly pilin Flp
MNIPGAENMRRMNSRIGRFWRAEEGQDIVEYALLTGLIAVVVAGFLPPSLMPSVSTIFSKCASIVSTS